MQSNKIESGRAEFALKEVKRVVETNGVKLKEYKSYCRKFPSMVQTNGIAASVAFMLDKGGTYDHLYDNINGWLKECKLLPEKTTLETYVCSLDSVQYRVVTKEVLALFNWIRRFASGLIEGDA
ncbi:MAG: type III-B CRISPR module-associated protein Cmr5 [Oscillospiraceae bacterium]|nr:type III-B CRISPR module-associated protein Cmr5 [Oscillospiraceae bacterium]